MDRSVDRVFDTLEETGEADNTIVFLTSDNGVFYGEHRKRVGKKLPYDPAARVPFAVWPVDGSRANPQVSDATTGAIDIAPTILELAGLEGEHRMDGRSLVDVLRGRENVWPTDRGLVLEVGKADKCVGYRALRTPRYLYTEYRKPVEDECTVSVQELYDVRRDPLQLVNRLGLPRGTEPADEARADQLAKRLAVLNQCSGVEGRDPATSDPFCE